MNRIGTGWDIHALEEGHDLILGGVRIDSPRGCVGHSDGDALILPGGYPGYVNLAENEVVGQTLRTYYDSGRFVAAICGAPTVLQRYGVAKGSRVAVHHSCAGEMKDYVISSHNVEQDRHLITASGAGHAVEFALALLYALQGERKVAHVKEGMELH